MIETIILNITKVVSLLPFGYAFGAGMVTTVSPCGVSMLLAHISLYLESRQDNFWSEKSQLRRSGHALIISAVVTLGLVIFFGVMGVLISLGGQFLIRLIPWIAVLIGVALIILGIYLLKGGHIYSSLPQRLANRLNSGRRTNIKDFLIFGFAYGIAALSCTLPIFLVVVGGALALKGLTSGLLQFVSYALGIGFVITLVTLGSALFQDALNRWLHRLTPVITRLSGLLLILAGGYILYYWFKVGDILNWTFQ